jgi:trehalose 6-phosphate synthase
MLANDFIGFHTKEYCDNYLEALQEWFPVDIRIRGRFYEIIHRDLITTIGALPIGLDVDKILSEVAGDKKLDFKLGKENLLSKINQDKKAGKYIFGGLERCDYTKGLVERLGVFYHALSKLKNEKKDARLYQVTSPSRGDNPDYQVLHAIMAEEVEKINEKMGESAVIHLDQGVPAPQNYRFMKEVDVMLVTPLDDGMNLVVFEYILSQKYKAPEDRGFLVLGTSGASRVLGEKGFSEEDGIVYINPMRVKEAGDRTAMALSQGCRISDRVINYVERDRRVGDWAEQNMEAILNCRREL